jgi:2',5'-phosphodiesterase
MIQSCLPTITRVSTFGSFHDTHVFENTPIVVEVDVLHSTDVLISWFADGQLVCANSAYYTPTSCDVNKVLTVVIVPHRPDHNGKGCEEAYQFQRRVEELPALPIIRPLREEFLNRPDSTQSLRVVTYNILADQNVARDYDNADRMYSHCKDEYLVKWRRHPLIVHEILQYHSDIIALQEVDTDVYTDLLKPVMTAMGYEGYFSQKGVGATSGVREGCVIFWSIRMFERVRPVDMQTRSYREMIQKFCHEEYLHKSHWKSMGDIMHLLNTHDELKNVMFNKLGHVLQTVVLTHKQSQEKVVVANTHLFYSPLANHIRCLQMLVACRQLDIEHQENQNCPVIFCGDLNSPPDSGVMKLMLDRNVDANIGKTWENLRLFEWEKGKGAGVQRDVQAIDLELPESFPSFLSAYHPSPEFTFYFKNDIEEFICTLDHILVTSNFEVEKTGSTPTRNDVERFISMPNVSMPSDHVSLVCDLKWN